MTTEKKDYVNDYKKRTLKRIPLEVSKGKYDQIKTAADSAGISVNGWIKKLIDGALKAQEKSTVDNVLEYDKESDGYTPEESEAVISGAQGDFMAALNDFQPPKKAEESAEDSQGMEDIWKAMEAEEKEKKAAQKANYVNPFGRLTEEQKAANAKIFGNK